MIARIALAMLLCTASTACGPSHDEDLSVVFVDNDDAPGSMEQHRRMATEMGLVTFDAAALVRPGIAERWVISDDGLSYIFRLADRQWADGTDVTARDVVNMVRERLRALRRGPMGSELGIIGEVIARTDQIVEIQLDAPVPRLLDLLASPEMTLARKGKGMGPMRMIEGNDGGYLFLPLHDDGGETGAGARTVLARSLPPAEAIAAYRAGMADILFDLRYASTPLLSAGEIPDEAVVKDPSLGHFGLDIPNAKGALESAQVREAIAMALDRPRLLSAFGIADWREMITLVPPELITRGDVPAAAWQAYDIVERKDRARIRVAEAGLTGADISIYMPEEGPGRALLFGLLRQNMAEIGLRLTMADRREKADMILVDLVADFDDPLWYLARLDCSQRSLCDPEADRLIEEARNLPTLTDRQPLLAEAETRLNQLSAFIPLADPLRLSITRSARPGLEPSLRGLHPLQYLAAGPDR